MSTTAVVTGAASGIGRALATQLAREGHLVYLADLTPTDILAADLGGIAAIVDVADPAAMLALAGTASDAAIVCLNAGIVGATTGAPWEASPEEWDHVVGVNVGGVVNGLRAFVPQLLATGRPANLVITASLAGVLTFPGGGAYAASKHAVVAVAEQAALRLEGTNISVTLLCPALVRSGMSTIGASADEVAAAALTTARAGRFLAVPDEWQDAVRHRSEALLSGEQPRMPTPRSAAVHEGG